MKREKNPERFGVVLVGVAGMLAGTAVVVATDSIDEASEAAVERILGAREPDADVAGVGYASRPFG